MAKKEVTLNLPENFVSRGISKKLPLWAFWVAVLKTILFLFVSSQTNFNCGILRKVTFHVFKFDVTTMSRRERLMILNLRIKINTVFFWFFRKYLLVFLHYQILVYRLNLLIDRLKLYNLYKEQEKSLRNKIFPKILN